MDFWIKAAQLFLSLAILVTLHEFGHFIAARAFKTKVESFFLAAPIPTAIDYI